MASVKRANTSGITKSGTAIADVPDAPTIGVATAAGLSASVTFTAAVTGGTPTSYTVTSNPGSLTGTGASAPITVSGLSDGTAYTFTATATNSSGTSAASSASNSITAVLPMEGAYDALANVTVDAGGVSSITFSSIPTDYKHLQLRISATTAANANVRHYVNGDTGANKTKHGLVAYGTSGPNGDPSTGESQPVLTAMQPTYPGVCVVDFLDYANTNRYKVWRSLAGTDSNGASLARIYFTSFLWMDTSIITSITLVAESTTFNQYSSFALYGVK